MSTQNRFSFIAAIFAVAALLGGCTSASIQEAKVISPEAQKTKKLLVVYRNVPLTETSSKGGDKSSVGYKQELLDFGKLLLKEAQPVFAQNGVVVTATDTIYAEAPVPLGSVPKEKGEIATPTLLITPMSGTTYTRTSNSSQYNSIQVDYIFALQLIDLASRRMVWTAKINTGYRDARDSRFGNDREYAAKLLGVVAGQMKHDGLI